jgi:hypothetical protein
MALALPTAMMSLDQEQCESGLVFVAGQGQHGRLTLFLFLPSSVFFFAFQNRAHLISTSIFFLCFVVFSSLSSVDYLCITKCGEQVAVHMIPLGNGLITGA